MKKLLEHEENMKSRPPPGDYRYEADEELIAKEQEAAQAQFRPTPQQESFREIAIECVEDSHVRVSFWRSAAKEAGNAVSNKEWQAWSRDEQFRGWFWAEIGIEAITSEEAELYDKLFMEKLVEGVENGSAKHLSLYAKLRYRDKNLADKQANEEEMANWAQPIESGWE